MKSDRAEFYDSLLSDLPDYISLVFFFRADEADEKTFSASTRLPSGRISALVRRNGLIVEFKKESEQKLYSWIKRHFAHDGAQITDAGIEQLVAMCGSEMYVLAGETEKLICSYNGTPITEDDVKRVCCANSAYRIFDMSAAVASGDYTRAGGILEYLIFEKTPPELILATLGRCFSDMLFVGDALGRGEDFRSVAASLKMQEWQVRRTASNASRAGSGFARYAISECVRTDRRLKSVSCSAYPAIRLLLAKLSMYGKDKRLLLDYPVVVEGKYDKIKLSGVVASPIVAVNGFSVFNNSQMRLLLRRLAASGRIIVLTDSDGAGRLIRSRIRDFLPVESIIDLHIPRIKGKESRKGAPSKENLLGVEGMDDRLLYDLLLPYSDGGGKARREFVIDRTRFYEDGFLGAVNSAAARDALAAELGLPEGLTSGALLQAISAAVSEDEYISARDRVKKGLEST